MWTGRLLDAEVQIHGFCTSVHFQRIKTAVANKIFQYILLLRLANLFPGCLFNMMIYISRESTKHMPGQGCQGCMSTNAIYPEDSRHTLNLFKSSKIG